MAWSGQETSGSKSRARLPAAALSQKFALDTGPGPPHDFQKFLKPPNNNRESPHLRPPLHTFSRGGLCREPRPSFELET